MVEYEPPLTAPPILVGEMMILPAETVREKLAAATIPVLSTALMVIVDVPVAEATPEMMPVDWPRLMPVGSAPLAMNQE